MSSTDWSYELIGIIKSSSSNNENLRKDSNIKVIISLRAAFRDMNNEDPDFLPIWFPKHAQS